MKRQPKLMGVLCAVAVALVLPGCGTPIPIEQVPPGWELNVHQPGVWWTQPLIPRSVVVRRCPPRPGWSSLPDLTKVDALPPGIDVNYSMWGDDYHCLIGWSEPAIEVVEFAPEEATTEAGLRRICSSTGLPMDSSWRFLGYQTGQRVGDLPDVEEGMEPWQYATAGFIDRDNTVVGCMVSHHGEAGAGASVELSVGGEAEPSTVAACPVKLGQLARGGEGTLESGEGTLEYYELRGAGVARDSEGRVLTEATKLQIGVAGDSVKTSHPVVDGVAIVDAWVFPTTAIHFEWEQPPQLEGQVYGSDGSVLATCRS